MPLRDHFHAPLMIDRDREDFHSGWAVTIRNHLNQHLPEEYFALARTRAAANMEIDVATFEEGTNGAAKTRSKGGGTATLTPNQTWIESPPTETIRALFVDDFEVQVYSTETGRTLVAAIELVSPRNKDRPAARRAFAVKCASLLHQGISVIIVDIVTNRKASLHQEVLRLLTAKPAKSDASAMELYAIAYRPVRRDSIEEIDIWANRLTLGTSLPTVPLWLRSDLCLPIDLDASYSDSCRDSRIR